MSHDNAVYAIYGLLTIYHSLLFVCDLCPLHAVDKDYFPFLILLIFFILFGFIFENVIR